MLNVPINKTVKKPKKFTNDAEIADWNDSWEASAKSFRAKIKELHARYKPRCLAFYQGRNRSVYVMKNLVVKIPRNFDGIADNDWEGSVSNGGDEDPKGWEIIYARTRMHYHGEIPVVFMERVDPALSSEIKLRLGSVPNWTGRVDCEQVGFTRRGKLVAYDYGMR